MSIGLVGATDRNVESVQRGAREVLVRQEAEGRGIPSTPGLSHLGVVVDRYDDAVEIHHLLHLATVYKMWCHALKHFDTVETV